MFWYFRAKDVYKTFSLNYRF